MVFIRWIYSGGLLCRLIPFALILLALPDIQCCKINLLQSGGNAGELAFQES